MKFKSIKPQTKKFVFYILKIKNQFNKVLKINKATTRKPYLE